MKKWRLKARLAQAQRTLNDRPIVYVAPDGEALLAELRRRLDEALKPWSPETPCTPEITQLPSCLIVSGPGSWLAEIETDGVVDERMTARSLNGPMHIVVPATYRDEAPLRVTIHQETQ